MLNTRVVTLEKILFPIFCPRRSLKHYFNPIVISFAVKVTDHLSLGAEKNSHKRVDPKMGKLEKRLGGFTRERAPPAVAACKRRQGEER